MQGKTTEQMAECILDAVKMRERQGKKVFIAIDGRCAAGKTTLAGYLQETYGWSVVHMDDFFLRPWQRTEERLAKPGGNVDYERVLEEVLIPLSKEQAVSYHPYDCKMQKMQKKIELQPKTVQIFEGSYSCHPALREYYSLKIFLDISKEEQLERIIRRNGQTVRMFQEKWIPLEELYFSECDVKACCNLCL